MGPALPLLLTLLLLDYTTCHSPARLREDLREKEERLPKDCGVSGATVRVVGGKTTIAGEYPWMALLGYMTERWPIRFLGWWCGGTLVTDRYVLTAAHCVNPDELITPSKEGSFISMELVLVRLGEHTVGTRADGVTPVDYEPEGVFFHEERDRLLGTHDIGIIKLSEKVTFTESIRPICLPSAALRRKRLAKEWATVAGWGQTDYNVSSSKLELLQAHLKVTSVLECRKNLTSLKEMGIRPITKYQICAGLRSTGSCQGDSGGPLMYHFPSKDGTARLYQIGIVSYGYKCAIEGYPSVYTRVSVYMNWILDRLDI